MNQLLLLTGVEIKEYIREPGIVFWAVLFPILLALGLGMAFSGNAQLDRTIGIICENECLTAQYTASNPLLIGNAELGHSKYIFKKVNWDEAILMLKQGKTGLIIEEFNGEIVYHFDPNNADAKLSYLQLSAFFDNSGSIASESNNIKVLKQEGTRYIDFLVPGIMAMSIMMSCMWGISYSNVDRRNRKLLRRMVATPMKKHNYVISQLISRIIMSAIEAALLIFITMWIFEIRISGSITALLLMFLAGNVFFGGLAWLLASRTSNTRIANGLINLVIMPMMILSGIYFSYHNFPEFMVRIIQYLPLTILADSIRSIFIEGAGISQIILPFVILSLLGTSLLAIGIKVYKWY